MVLKSNHKRDDYHCISWLHDLSKKIKFPIELSSEFYNTADIEFCNVAKYIFDPGPSPSGYIQHI